MRGASVIIIMARNTHAMMTVVDFVVSRLVVVVVVVVAVIVVDVLRCFVLREE